ncbi:MAG TPA: hypothetical protein VGW78_00095 [Candidatus Babeliales bacterium]|nr:hypothetical protein [Candidatus Babeliales bacterium]
MNYSYAITILVRHIPFDHITLCTIGNIDKESRKILISTAPERQILLKHHIQNQPNLFPVEQQYYAWHPYGSACSYIESFDILQEDEWDSRNSSWTTLINLCILQLASNNRTRKYSNTIMSLHEGGNPTLFPEKYSPYYQKALQSGYLKYICEDSYQTRIGVPFFDVHGNACTHMYNTQDSGCVMYHAIDNEGNSTKCPCSFEYKDTLHSLKILTRTPFFIPFIHSTQTFDNNKEKIYKTDSVRINGQPLSADHHAQLTSYIENFYLWI